MVKVVARIHFIVNPLRPSIGLQWPYEEKKIQAVTEDFEVHITRGRFHAEILTRQAIQDGAELLVCVGGDSTLSEMVNGLYRASLGGGRTPKITLYPELQAGDTARTLRLQKGFLEFLDNYLKGTVQEEKLDLGEIEFAGDHGQKVRRLFINCAGCGLSSTMVAKLSQDYRVSRSRFNFLRLLTRLLLFYRHPDVNIQIDGQRMLTNAPILTTLVHNGRYAGYGLQFSPESSVIDGQFEVSVMLKTFSFRYLLSIFPLFAGNFKNLSFVRRWQAKEILIEPSTTIAKRVRMDFDGDTWGFLPMRVRVLEGAVTLLR
mgnify:CR=1 FL=1